MMRIKRRKAINIYRKKKKKSFKINKDSIKILYLFVIVILIVVLFINNKTKNNIDIPIENVMSFKITYENIASLKQISEKYNMDFSELVTYYSIENKYFENKIGTDSMIEQNFVMNFNDIKKKYKEKKVEKYYKLFDTIYKEIKCFPISVAEGENIEYVYGDSWGAARTYGGNRIHMGTDIMDRENIRGRIPVVSMTDGIVENLGWNEKGGWRVGIRTEKGTYYYYAHLDEYDDSIVKGMNVSAGQLLGYMGDTGYSKVEGTKGKFEVHLHIGISPTTDLYDKEFWINPYPFLRMIENNISQ